MIKFTSIQPIIAMSTWFRLSFLCEIKSKKITHYIENQMGFLKMNLEYLFNNIDKPPSVER